MTDDTLTGRGGLALFSRYLTKIGIYALLEEQFGHIRRSRKGLAVWKLFKQVLCFFFDGTSRHLSYFNHLKKDEGYAGIIEETPKELATSHAIKRFMKSFPLAFWWNIQEAPAVSLSLASEDRETGRDRAYSGHDGHGQ